MKRTDENRYPQSAELFKFCKEALNIKHNFEVKVIDQHVGAILGFDPADCSHWKKGKKNIKSLDTVKAIAQHLDADERDVLDIISGRKNLEEALEEYKGFGQTALSLRQIDELKREYFRNTTRYQTSLGINSFEEFVDTKRDVTVATAEELLLRARVNSLPVMLPELTEVIDSTLVIEASNDTNVPMIQVAHFDGRTTVTHRAVDMKPFLRFLLAREIGRHVLLGSSYLPEQTPIVDVRLNIFAIAILMPAPLLQTALRHADPSCDLVDQLATLFWLPRSIVSSQLRDFIVQ
jgi:hypothetical protein